MPSKNPEVNKRARDKWYKNNKKKQIRRQAARRKERLEELHKLKSSLRCTDCGLEFLGKEKMLDFHHLDPLVKDMSIRESAFYSDKRMKEELSKCIPLCANCHRMRH